MIYSHDMHSAIGNLSLQHEPDSETGPASVSMKRQRSEEELQAFQHKQRRRTTSSSEEDGMRKVYFSTQGEHKIRIYGLGFVDVTVNKPYFCQMFKKTSSLNTPGDYPFVILQRLQSQTMEKLETKRLYLLILFR